MNVPVRREKYGARNGPVRSRQTSFEKENSELVKGRYRLFTPVKDNDSDKELGTLTMYHLLMLVAQTKRGLMS